MLDPANDLGAEGSQQRQRRRAVMRDEQTGHRLAVVWPRLPLAVVLLVSSSRLACDGPTIEQRQHLVSIVLVACAQHFAVTLHVHLLQRVLDAFALCGVHRQHCERIWRDHSLDLDL